MFTKNNPLSCAFASVFIQRMLILICLIGPAANADVFTFNQETLIAATDTTYDNHDIVIDGAEVTIDGEHAFESLKIINGGVVTHSVEQSINITVNGPIEIDSTSSIDVSGKGLLGDSSAGRYTGGSHGGRGGNYGSELSGSVHGEYRTPDDVGYGGRNSSTNGTGSVRGGGAIKLVADELSLDGSILANGVSGPLNQSHGAGAGGSIWLDVGALVSANGTGEIRANGGLGSSYGGGGGGGRIAVHYETLIDVDQS